MPLPEYVAPILAAGGPVGLAFVFLRFGPDAVLRLVAGTVAALTRDEKRGARCLEVLRILRNRDSPRSRLMAVRSAPTFTVALRSALLGMWPTRTT